MGQAAVTKRPRRPLRIGERVKHYEFGKTGEVVALHPHADPSFDEVTVLLDEFNVRRTSYAHSWVRLSESTMN